MGCWDRRPLTFLILKFSDRIFGLLSKVLVDKIIPTNSQLNRGQSQPQVQPRRESSVFHPVPHPPLPGNAAEPTLSLRKLSSWAFHVMLPPNCTSQSSVLLDTWALEFNYLISSPGSIFPAYVTSSYILIFLTYKW